MIRFRVYGFGASETIKIRDLRQKHVGKFIALEGVIRIVSNIRPMAEYLQYRCKTCNKITIKFPYEGAFYRPRKCDCGSTFFIEIGGRYHDAQRLTLEEPMDLVEGGKQPQRVNVLLTDDLTSFDKNIPGMRIIITGWLELQKKKKESKTTQEFDWFFKANAITPLTGDLTADMTASKELMEDFKKFVKDGDPIKKLVGMIAPDIIGHEDVKQAMLFQMAGGVKIRDTDGRIKRVGDLHILVVSDPGIGKSRLGYAIQNLAPRSRYVDGKGASGVGLTASVVKDELMGGWAVEAGAIVLAHEGILAIDEFDKMAEDDRRAMHVAMTEQIVQKDKANVHVTMKAETAILALANPKHGRFDSYSTLAEQINLEASLINRFDLIFAIKDIPDEKKDTAIFNAIVKARDKRRNKKVDTVWFKRYITYIKTLEPKLTRESEKVLEKFYVGMRKRNSDSGQRHIPISPRQADTLIKLSQASARLHMSEVVEIRDANIALSMMKKFLERLALDKEAGVFDVSLIDGITPVSKRNKMHFVYNKLKEFTGVPGVQSVGFDILHKACKELDMNVPELEELLEKMKQTGDIFEPRIAEYAPLG